jgi:NAD(P)-dependent dehydrogenase (short-subunit alcohol dehydrogenase family)
MSGIRTYHKFDLKDTPSLSKKVAIVTGGNAGIGREIVAQLLLHDISKVYVLARSSHKFETAKTYWKETHGFDISDGTVEFATCDLSDMVAVKKVADELVGKLGRLDILINNAGTYILLITS